MNIVYFIVKRSSIKLDCFCVIFGELKVGYNYIYVLFDFFIELISF